MAEEAGELDVTGPGGLGIRTKGYRLMDMVCLASAFGVGYICIAMFNHAAEAKDESRAQTVAIQENTRVQREQIAEMRVANCLAALTIEQKRSEQTIMFCKSLSRPN